MPITDTSLFRGRLEIVNSMLAALQSAVPEVYMGEDGVVRILFEVEAAQLENAFLANQLLLEELFPQTASPGALDLYGQTYGLDLKVGEKAIGELTWTGGGATDIPIGTIAAASLGAGADLIQFLTTEVGTIPDPDDPTPPDAAINAVAGNLNGTYEYVTTFVNTSGETLPSEESNAVSPVSQKVDVSNIVIGGTGVTARRIYRRKNGIGNFSRVTTINDNTTTTYLDNIADASVGVSAPLVDTAHSITVNAEAELVGEDSNIAAGLATLIINAPSGVTDVINNNSFLGGENPESSQEFRARLLEFLRNPETGSSADLKFWAETVEGVEQATVFNNDNVGTPTNGHATVRIAGPGGIIPDADVIAEVQKVLDAEALANITIHVTTFTPLLQDVTVDVTPDTAHTLGDVTPSVVDAISDYILSLSVGDTLRISGIIDAVFGLNGVLDVVLTSPVANQTSTNTQKFIPDDITVT